MSGTSLGFVAQNESISSPSAAPRGLARVATAVALVRPLSENQRSLYRVGALRQNGCASPMRICPNMATPKLPPRALVPAYRIQFPARRRERGSDNGGFRAAFIEGEDHDADRVSRLAQSLPSTQDRCRYSGLNSRAGDTKRKEVPRAHPIDSTLRDPEMLSGSG